MNSKKKRRGQMSEAFCTAMFLSLSGGLQDVYTYLFRGKVFANAQTGNIVLMAVHAFASTMCIGNMRSGMDSLCSWVLNRNPAALKKSFYYLGIILLFALGAGLGSLTLDLCGAKAIWFSCLLLAVSFCLMFLKEDVEEIKEDLEALEAKH